MASENNRPQWGGRWWVLLLIAIVLAVVILLVLLPRPLAWVSPPPTPLPYTPAPGLYQIPTVSP